MIAIVPILLRILPYLALIVALGYVYHSIYQSGVERERNKQAQRDAEVKVELQKRQQVYETRIKNIEEEQKTKLMEVQNDHAKDNEKLNSTIRNLSKRGLYITATKCDGVQGATEGTDTSGTIPGHQQGRKIRLPEETERNLWSIAGDAGDVVSKYNACREILTSPVCNVELTP